MAYTELFSWAHSDPNAIQLVDRRPCIGRYLRQDINDLYRPLPVELPENVDSIRCGHNFCAALMQNGDVFTWGDNNFGALGHGREFESTGFTFLPKKIEALHNLHVCSLYCSSAASAVVTRDGQLYVWGGVFSIELDTIIVWQYTPTRVTIDGVNRVCSVAISLNHLCVIDERNRLSIVPLENVRPVDTGQTLTLQPDRVIDDVSFVSCHDFCFAIVKTDGRFYTWGMENRFCKLGHDHANPVEQPTQVAIDNVASVVFNYENAAVITHEGHLYTCGNHQKFMLGYATAQNQVGFRRVENVENIRKVCLSENFVAALDNNDELYIWGRRIDTDGTFIPTTPTQNQIEPVRVRDQAFANGILDISCSSTVICAVHAPPIIKAVVAAPKRRKLDGGSSALLLLLE